MESWQLTNLHRGVLVTALLKFDTGVSAQIATAVAVRLQNTATIFGSHGSIHLPRPWLPADENGAWSFELHRDGKTEIISGEAAPLYVLEAEHVTDLLREGAMQSPLLSWQDSLNQALALDTWRREIGLAGVIARKTKCHGDDGQLVTIVKSCLIHTHPVPQAVS